MTSIVVLTIIYHLGIGLVHALSINFYHMFFKYYLLFILLQDMNSQDQMLLMLQCSRLRPELEVYDTDSISMFVSLGLKPAELVNVFPMHLISQA